MNLKIRITSDNSPTLYLEELNETYHSVHGAQQESEHVYIKSGLSEFNGNNDVRIFEMGFGTGLNVLLTRNYAKENGMRIHFTSVELYPLPIDIWSQLNYTSNLLEKEFFTSIHQSTWGENTVIDPDFELVKHKISLAEVDYESEFDLIYFDAFGPDKQPDMWTINIFEKMYKMLDKGGVFVTYSAKGQVRRDLQSAGFKVERIPGPPGKREMLRARKI
jgi:tRNA U34 5-methylaminomethyl-2-thiouridine-forming methyltransferase MnmC